MNIPLGYVTGLNAPDEWYMFFQNRMYNGFISGGGGGKKKSQIIKGRKFARRSFRKIIRYIKRWVYIMRWVRGCASEELQQRPLLVVGVVISNAVARCCTRETTDKFFFSPVYFRLSTSRTEKADSLNYSRISRTITCIRRWMRKTNFGLPRSSESAWDRRTCRRCLRSSRTRNSLQDSSAWPARAAGHGFAGSQRWGWPNTGNSSGRTTGLSKTNSSKARIRKSTIVSSYLM